MERVTADLEATGRMVREALDRELGGEAEAELRAVRARLVDRWTVGKVPSRPVPLRRLGWVVGAGGLVAGATALVLMLSVRRPLTFTLEGVGSSAKVGDLVEATGSVPARLTFSEGSEVVVQRGGRVRVLGTERATPRVLLEAGSLDATITHRAERPMTWRFDAGPFFVTVAGTRFDLSWDPASHALSLGAKEGAATLAGGCVNGQRSVAAGERVTVSCVTVTSRASTPAGRVLETAAPEELEAAPVPAERPTRLLWREALARGQRDVALREAIRADFGKVCRSATSHELLELADTARLSRRLPEARRALLTLRQRFPHSSDAATAAFVLGRVDFEQRQRYQDASGWFAAYLEENPQGPLMGDALGRLMEARERAGEHEQARRDAAKYLGRFREGPYAREARALLGP